jgi:hypothetical protein
MGTIVATMVVDIPFMRTGNLPLAFKVTYQLVLLPLTRITATATATAKAKAIVTATVALIITSIALTPKAKRRLWGQFSPSCNMLYFLSYQFTASGLACP